ncbi:uncharacterized protein EV420DRAFT_1691455 [Desarmillaria tabescens]|uniref:Uncharacterized protein n=1 Tax=Armillaria tabescens TaxID=1929756 RepID=A0AA39KA87_ARMTA|nr:uncharacterized protein EV420DRAFT_1691455 [Desarmillaria tabescens]KAK0457133.1 hypothetical protein EV420DRAFT_1691455 [Desarmillaria tabescens]
MKVPPHATAHIWSVDIDSEHVLVRDGHVLRVFTPKWRLIEQNNKSEHELEVDHFVSLIETLISTIDFEQSSTAFLPIKLLIRPGSALSMSAKLKLPSGYDMNRRGRWNNTDVEIWYGWEDRYLRFVQRTMVSLDALRQRNLDLHFKVLGHLVRDDKVVGIVMEPNGGRYVKFSDRALAYNAFQELQKHNLLLDCPQFSFFNMKIADGKVRFESRTLQILRDVSYERDLERLAWVRKNHWDSLDPMMDILESLARARNKNPQTIANAVRERVDCRLLAYIPFPERPLLLAISSNHYFDIIRNQHHRANTQKMRLPLLSKCGEHPPV